MTGGFEREVVNSGWYCRTEDKLSASAGSNRLWSGMTKLLNLNSKGHVPRA